MNTASVNNTPFWFVWNPSGRAPTCKHDSEQNARLEAERLARCNRGETFIVLESVVAVCITDVQYVDMRPPVRGRWHVDHDDELPF